MDRVTSFFIGFIVGGIIFALFIGDSADVHWEKKAVEHNAGQFIVIDSTKGTTAFRWKDEINNGQQK